MRTPTLGFARLLIISLAVATIALVGAPPQVTLGVSITVSTTDDDEVANGNCTLREAIVAANTNANVDLCMGAGGTVNDLIMFNLGTGTPKIEIGAVPLPPITEWAVMAGNTGGATRVEINGPGGFVGGNDGLEVAATGAGTVIHAMVINNSADDGILILADEVTVTDSLIGLDATGTMAMPNGGFGIQVHGNGNRIGQFNNSACTGTCNRNVIAASAQGKSNVLLDFDATGSFVRGNYIGTDVTGTVAISPNNVYGIIDKGIGTTIGGVTGTTPGGACTGDCNLVSGNLSGGVLLQEPGSQSLILGNYIGTDAAGTAGIGNGFNAGVRVQTPNAVIGGTTPEGRNVISGNTLAGVFALAIGVLVQGNYVGVDSTGSAAIPSSGNGVVITGTDGATVGGTVVGAGNVISGAAVGYNGIAMDHATNSKVLGNLIGTARDGVSPVPNSDSGVSIYNQSSNNIVGGVVGGSANVIAYNGLDGVEVDGLGPPVRSNTISRNSIYANGDQGVRLAADANDDLAAPVIAGVNPVTGTACPGCIVEVFSDDEDEGRLFEGSTFADGTGAWTYATPVTGPNVTATATDNSNNTSQFSAPFPVGTGTPTPTPEPTATATPEPTATPTSTPSETTQRIWGDLDCSGQVGSRDNQSLLRVVLDQDPLSQTQPCPGIGALVSVDGTNWLWGDNDCSGGIGSRDNQGLLRFVLDQVALSQTEPCPDIGDEVEVGIARV